MNKKIPALVLILFFRQLATLISAGVPIIQALDILRHGQSNKILRYLLMIIKQDLEAGNALSACLSKFPRYFDVLTCHLIQIGEQSGTMVIMLNRIASHKEKLLSMQNKLKQVLFYPAIVMLVAMTVTIIMLTMVVPRFAELFQTMHHTLPAFTLTIIHLSEWVCHYYWLMLFPVTAIVPLIYYFHHSALLRNKIERLILQLPYVGPIYTKIILSRFCRTLATTFSAGVPISDCLHSIAYATGSHFYAQIVLKLRVQITKGQQLHQAMQKHPVFPHLLIEMVKVGEESGTLEKMLEKMATIYESDLEHGMAMCGHLLEPLIMVILGVLIGGLVIAMYLPIFKLGTAI